MEQAGRLGSRWLRRGWRAALNQVNCLEVEIRSRITITTQRKLALFTL